MYHLIVDSEWAKANPRRAAKIQVAYLLRLVRERSQSVSAGKGSGTQCPVRAQRKALGEAAKSI
ncbi:MAG TPA: hypothetical protein VM366_15220 [Anaerolineae bacterium]|nr:hypothetical protein [Anaerolineae bacterium]